MHSRSFQLGAVCVVAWALSLSVASAAPPPKSNVSEDPVVALQRELASAPPPRSTSPEIREEDPIASLQRALEKLRVKTVHGDLAGQLRAFYAARGHTLVWEDREREADALLAAICDAQKEGLSPALLSMDEVREAREKARVEKSLESRVAADVVLTAAFFRIGALLDRGQLPPKKHRWNIPDEPTDLAAALERGLARNDPARALKELAPPHASYEQLRDALETLRKVAAEGGWPVLSKGPTLEEGSAGERVAELRARLRASGDLEDDVIDPEAEQSLASGALAGDARERSFDAELKAALIRYQQRHGLAPDGIVHKGGATASSLGETVAERIVQLEVNLERWRWLPRDFPERHVRVNVPAQELEAFKEDERAFTSAVVVGSSGWPTPVLLDQIEAIEVNPQWWVPRRIAEAEVLPLLQEKPEWAKSRGFRLIERETGESHAPDQLELEEGDYETYAIVQGAGGFNPLGSAKFVMRNRYSIFLHGTDAPEVFELPQRTRSHGCVRVQEVDALADFITEGANEKSAAFTEAKESGARTRVALDSAMPVLLVYFTSWVDQDGSLRFAPDVYGHDRRVERAFSGENDEAPSC